MPTTATPPLALRAYQIEALEAVEQAEARGIRRQVLALPTGCGKTVIFAELIRRRSGRALVLVHRDELLQQASEKLTVVGLPAGVVKAERDEVGEQVVVASVQTLSRAARLDRLPLGFRTVVVDECHHAAADSYRRILERVESSAPPPLVLGVSATPERADGVPLEGFQVVYRRQLREMIAAGYLSDLRAVQVRLASADYRLLHTRAGDFIDAEAEALLLDANAPEYAVQAYLAHAKDRRALVFTPTVKVAHAMADVFASAGVPAATIDAETPSDERRDILASFRRGPLRVVANCAVLTEGFDEPLIDCVIVARPTRSRVLYTQMVGRGTRKLPVKDDCLIVDLVGATDRHDLMTVDKVLGVSARTLRHRGAVAAIAEQDAQAAGRAATGRLVAQAVDLFARRPMHWIRAGGRFALSLGTAGTLVLLPVGTGWRAVVRSRDGVKVLGDGLPLEYAQGTAEDFARRAGAGTLVDPAAPWRAAPATDRQLAALKRRGVSSRPGLTKGEASDLLAAAFIGGRA
ncbi:MAG TPA: DEAD/DEAH box helicase [Methylomirabilota bacterium]|nr:DEAD/DEAH box helicase [Methylomirabilota bacterium]